jgi:hypothetical protein
MTKISPIDFKAGIGFNDEIGAGERFAYIDNESGKPATSATKAKMASHPYNVADGVTDAGKLHSGAIEEGLCAAD